MRADFQLGLIGHPVAHSRSPQLHGALLELADLSGSYQLFDVEPKNLAQFFSLERKRLNLSGVNVTIPHKVEAMAYIDSLDEKARLTGAVNTIRFENDDTCTGYNTDIYGFCRALEEAYDGVGRGALVYGYGGAARAVLLNLLERGFERIYFGGRDRKKLEIFLNQFAIPLLKELSSGASILLFEDTTPGPGDCDLLINCAPVGQSPSTSPLTKDKSLPESLSSMLGAMDRSGKSGLVFDLVYAPDRKTKTALLAKAEELGLQGEDGYHMLIYQALKSFSLWTGTEVDASKLKERLALLS